MKMRSVAVVGPGATGTVLAASLVRAGFDVRILARTEARAADLRRMGLRLRGRRPARPAVVSHRGKDLGRCGALILCVKSRDTSSALKRMRPAVGPDTLVMSIQNGLDHVAPLRRAFGSRAVFATAYFGATRTLDGVRHLGGGRIDVGATDRNRASARTAARLLRAAGWRVRSMRPEARALWTKLILNAATNPLGALAQVPNGRLADRPALRELMLRGLDEARRAALFHGVRPLVKRPDRWALRLCRLTAENMNSMAQDLAAGRPTEVEAILGPILRVLPDPERQAPVLSGLRRFVLALERS